MIIKDRGKEEKMLKENGCGFKSKRLNAGKLKMENNNEGKFGDIEA